MAHDGPRIKILLRSTAGTGCSYASTKNRRNDPGRLELRKDAPAIRKHVPFREDKIR